MHVSEIEKKLSTVAPLVFAGEVRTLQEELAKASSGQAFLLMGGDCAEVARLAYQYRFFLLFSTIFFFL